MYKYYFLLSRLLLNKTFSLKLFLNVSIIISVTVCSLVIPLTLSISNGFKANVENKIVNFDGFARIYNDDLNQKEKKYLLDNYSTSINSFSEKELIVRNNNISEGVTYAEIANINHLNEFLIHSYNDTDSGIYIGLQLHDKLFPYNESSNKSLFLIQDSENIYKKKVGGIFETGISLYDKHTIIEKNNNINPQGFILNKQDYINITNTLNIYGFTFKERYYTFIKWLDSYSLPINLLLFFIVLISLLNNSFCFNMDVINRQNDIKILYTLGFSKKSILELLFLKYSILNVFGFFIGSICCFLFLTIESNYKFIKLPGNIYFSSSLPISLKLINFLYVPCLLLINIIYKRIRLRRQLYEI